MGTPDYPGALEILRRDAGASLAWALAAACEPVPARDPVVYVIDFAREVLFPLAAGVDEEQVAGTVAGRVFTTGRWADPAASFRRPWWEGRHADFGDMPSGSGC